jgi:hypothetical protein
LTDDGESVGQHTCLQQILSSLIYWILSRNKAATQETPIIAMLISILIASKAVNKFTQKKHLHNHSINI